jgi:hypothetical protein
MISGKVGRGELAFFTQPRYNADKLNYECTLFTKKSPLWGVNSRACLVNPQSFTSECFDIPLQRTCALQRLRSSNQVAKKAFPTYDGWKHLLVGDFFRRL